MTDPAQDYVIKSVTIAEVLDANGERAITFDTEGDPADWELLGLLEYTAAVIRNHAAISDEDADE